MSSGSLQNISSKKKALFILTTFSGSILILEASLRLLMVFVNGPGILLYGTPFHKKHFERTYLEDVLSRDRPDAVKYLYGMKYEKWKKLRDVEMHENRSTGYTKYFPNQQKFDFDIETGERFVVKINESGFRGENFPKSKMKNHIRIACLGASSTFGYFDRDDQTYPVYMQEMLNSRKIGDYEYEVLNFGIPHLTSAEIYSLFLSEVLPLKPDIVTFYEGNNDSDPPQEWLYKSLAHAAVKKVGRYLVLARFIDSLVIQKIKIFQQSISEEEISRIKSNFIENISKINAICKEKKIIFVLSNQQKNSTIFDRNLLKTMTYQEEVEKIRHKLVNTGALVHPELAFLIHSDLMTEVENWAKVNKVHFVDIIKILNANRDVLVSWVHLSPEGNRMIADAFAEEINIIMADHSLPEGSD